MKSTLLLMLLSLLFQPGDATSAMVTSGSLAPDFTLENMQRERVRLAQLRGRVVIVNFWATWCPPCRTEMPSMEALHQRFPEGELAILAVNVEKQGRKAVAKLLQETPYSFPILLDDEAKVLGLYGVYQYPVSFIIDPNGVVTHKLFGAVDWMADDILHFLQSLTKD